MSKEIEKSLFSDLAQIIEQGKQQAVAQVNSTQTLTYWYVGKKINEHILNNQRAEYGKEIVAPVARQLVEEFGKSFELKNLYRMMQFAEKFMELEIVVPLARQFLIPRTFRHIASFDKDFLIQNFSRILTPIV